VRDRGRELRFFADDFRLADDFRFADDFAFDFEDDFVFVFDRGEADLDFDLAFDFDADFVFVFDRGEADFDFDFAFVLDFEADFVFVFDRDDADFVFVFEDDFDFDADFALVFVLREDDVFPLRLEVERREPPDRWVPPCSSEPSSSFPSSFFATPTAAGMATPIAAPAATFFGVDNPCPSVWSSSGGIGYAASLNASMNFGMMRSRTISGPWVARYFPAASAASSAIGMSASAAASQLVAAAEARMPDELPLFERPPPSASRSPPSPRDEPPLSCERTFLTA